MSGAGRGLWLGLVIWLGVIGLCRAGPAGDVADDQATSRQILVMLRLPPEHFRPGADYAGGYGDGMGRAARRRVALRLARQFSLTVADDWPMPLVGVDCFVLTVADSRSPADLAARLSRDPAVAWSEPMNLYHARSESTHNDPLYAVQPAAREWRLAALHKLATGRNVKVAVIDSTVERNHPDLIGQVETSQDFTPRRAASAEAHGTAVAGIIAARADNGVGIAGVAPGARLLALRACWQNAGSASPATVCDSLSLAKAIDFAIAHQAQVINLSLAGPPDQLLGKLLDVAETRHIAVVGAFDPALAGGGFPASHPGVVAVADESSGAPPAGVYSAPGRDVPTTTPGGHWSLVTGSSFAAAHVSGLMALLRERAHASNRSIVLVSARPSGGAVNPRASLVRVRCDCDRATLREEAAGTRR